MEYKKNRAEARARGATGRAADDYRVVRDDVGEWSPALFKAGNGEIQRVWCCAFFNLYMRFNFAAGSRTYSPNPCNIRWDIKGKTAEPWDKEESSPRHMPVRVLVSLPDAAAEEEVEAKSAGSDDNAIKGMDKVVLQAAKEDKDEVSPTACIVCMKRRVCVSFAPCSHMTCCATCVVAWMKEKATCPSCREPVQSVSCHILSTA